MSRDPNTDLIIAFACVAAGVALFIAFIVKAIQQRINQRYQKGEGPPP